MNEYAIIVLKEADIEGLTRLPQVEYIEKPKRLFFEVANGKRAIISSVVRGNPSRSGTPSFTTRSSLPDVSSGAVH